MRQTERQGNRGTDRHSFGANQDRFTFKAENIGSGQREGRGKSEGERQRAGNKAGQTERMEKKEQNKMGDEKLPFS